MQIITGKTGTDHVKPEMDRATHAAVFGADEYVLNCGNQFEATIEASDTIRLSAGEGTMQGIRFCIPFGTYDDLIIDNGTTGYKRKDLIVAEYKKVGFIESVLPVVIKGEPSANDPQTPEHTTGNILEGATFNQMPMYEVLLDGVNIISVTPLFTTITGLDDVYRKHETLVKSQIIDIELSGTVVLTANSPQVTKTFKNAAIKKNAIVLDIYLEGNSYNAHHIDTPPNIGNSQLAYYQQLVEINTSDGSIDVTYLQTATTYQSETVYLDGMHVVLMNR